MKKLPIGISTLAEIRDSGYIYVDKTHHVYNLFNSNKYYFLSRPRRFGKSLLVDTIKQASLANKNIFTGLYLENNWDWSIKYPVIHLDFGAGVMKSIQELSNLINAMLDRHYRQYDIENIYNNGVSIRFDYLINELAQKYQQKVVLLIDEYDKPILDNIDNDDRATETREGLKNLYSVIKTQDENLKFVLLTGVSKFSKVSLFSGLNNLQDIALDSKYADICGYNQTELEHAFAEYLLENKIDKQKLKQWYNGYNFNGNDNQKVYNPFDILLFFANGCGYRNYWFETATPTFLIKLLGKNKYFVPDLENAFINDKGLNSFDVGKIELITLLLQTGYLTIKEAMENPFSDLVTYRLTYPNYEVRNSLSDHLLSYFVPDFTVVNNSRFDLTNALVELNFDKMKDSLFSLFASIPYNWYINNKMNEYEGYYASIIYTCFNSCGIIAIPEDITNKGRIDLSIELPSSVLLFEFKLSALGDAKSAIAQIKAKNYAQKFASLNKPIYLLGMIFDVESRNISEFIWQKCD